MVESKRKKKKDLEFGTFRYFFKTKTMNPIDIYHQRLEYLKQKKRERIKNKHKEKGIENE